MLVLRVICFIPPTHWDDLVIRRLCALPERRITRSQIQQKILPTGLLPSKEAGLTTTIAERRVTRSQSQHVRSQHSSQLVQDVYMSVYKLSTPCLIMTNVILSKRCKTDSFTNQKFTRSETLKANELYSVRRNIRTINVLKLYIYLCVTKFCEHEFFFGKISPD